MNFNESLTIKYKITKNGFASKHFCFTPEFRAGGCERSWCAGTYFNCIMFMVASSVVTTIMVLNYHHRMVDTHDMPDWVKIIFLQVRKMLIAIWFESNLNIDTFEPKNNLFYLPCLVDAVAAANVPAGRKNNTENHSGLAFTFSTYPHDHSCLDLTSFFSLCRFSASIPVKLSFCWWWPNESLPVAPMSI